MNRSEKKLEISRIVERRKGDSSLREFASRLSEGAGDLNISFQTVNNWLNGDFLPDTKTLLKLLSLNDWRSEFAVELLNVIDPTINWSGVKNQ